MKQPRVDLELCIDCGISETKCPVLGRPAIYISNVGESKSKENQVLLMTRRCSAEKDEEVCDETDR